MGSKVRQQLGKYLGGYKQGSYEQRGQLENMSGSQLASQPRSKFSRWLGRQPSLELQGRFLRLKLSASPGKQLVRR